MSGALTTRRRNRQCFHRLATHPISADIPLESWEQADMRHFEDIPEKTIERLRHYINAGKPFGPQNSAEVQEEELRPLLFNINNELCAEYKKDPKIVVGRRGAGKSAIILNTQLIDKHDILVHLKPEDLLTYVREQLFPPNLQNLPYVEKTSRFWEILINSLLMNEVVVKVADPLPKVRKFLASAKIPGGSSGAAVLRALKKSADDYKGTIGSTVLHALLEFVEDTASGYDDALREIDHLFQGRRWRAVVIIDSLEDYRLHEPNNKEVLAGLLKCVGEYGNSRRHLRICLPGEAFFEIKNCSTNALKDLDKNLLLHWLPQEVFSIIASRSLFFVEFTTRNAICRFAVPIFPSDANYQR